MCFPMFCRRTNAADLPNANALLHARDVQDGKLESARDELDRITNPDRDAYTAGYAANIWRAKAEVKAQNGALKKCNREYQARLRYERKHPESKALATAAAGAASTPTTRRELPPKLAPATLESFV